MTSRKPLDRLIELSELRKETDLERTTREMFARWGEWRVAGPDDAARAKAAVEDAELAYERARAGLLASGSTEVAPDYATLQATTARLLRALVVADVDPAAVAALLAGRLARDLEGRPILGLPTARWRHVRPQRGVDMLELVDANDGRVLARLVHDRASPAPRWMSATWNEEKGGLGPDTTSS